jgi:thymidylate synthase ThyX
MKFISLRIAPGAQWEAQQVGLACLEIAKDLWPVAVEAYLEGKSK